MEGRIYFSIALLLLCSCDFVSPSTTKFLISDFEKPEVLELIDYTKGSVDINLSRNNATSGKNSLEIVVGPFEKHQYSWPRVEIYSKFFSRFLDINSLDFSYFSRIKADITNCGRENIQVLFGLTSFHYFDPYGTESEDTIFLIPAGNTITVEIDIKSLGKKRLNISSVKGIQFRFFPQAKDEIKVNIDNLRLEYEPAYGSPMEDLKKNADIYITRLKDINKMVNLDVKPGVKQEVLKSQKEYMEELTKISATAGKYIDIVKTGTKDGWGIYPDLMARFVNIKGKVDELVLIDKPEIYLWSISSYASISKKIVPDITSSPLKRIELTVAKREKRDSAFIITNNSKGEKRLKISVETVDKTLLKNIKIYQSLYLKDGKGADAFSLLEGILRIPAGESRELRISVDNRNGGLTPGRKEFNLVIIEDDGYEQKIDGIIEVKNINLAGYNVIKHNSYTEFSMFPFVTPDVLVRDMKESGLNVIYVLPGELPEIVSFDKGTYEVKVDPGKFIERMNLILNTWGKDSRPSFIFSISGFNKIGKDGPEYPSEEWKKMFKNWVKAFIQTVSGLGLEYSDWMFTIADESDEHNLITWEIPVAEIIKEVDGKVRIICNSSAIIRNKKDEERYFKVMDVFQPHLGPTPNPELYEWLKGSGKEMWFYRCSFTGDVYNDYRVYVWEVLKYGGTGIGVWTYCSNGGRNYYDPNGEKPTSYLLVVPHPYKENTVIPTLRYLTLIEGIDDCRYVYTLFKIAKDKGYTEQAKKMVDEAINDILQNRSDTTRCDRWRKKIIEKIENWNGK